VRLGRGDDDPPLGVEVVPEEIPSGVEDGSQGGFLGGSIDGSIAVAARPRFVSGGFDQGPERLGGGSQSVADDEATVGFVAIVAAGAGIVGTATAGAIAAVAFSSEGKTGGEGAAFGREEHVKLGYVSAVYLNLDISFSFIGFCGFCGLRLLLRLLLLLLLLWRIVVVNFCCRKLHLFVGLGRCIRFSSSRSPNLFFFFFFFFFLFQFFYKLFQIITR